MNISFELLYEYSGSDDCVLCHDIAGEGAWAFFLHLMNFTHDSFDLHYKSCDVIFFSLASQSSELEFESVAECIFFIIPSRDNVCGWQASELTTLYDVSCTIQQTFQNSPSHTQFSSTSSSQISAEATCFESLFSRQILWVFMKFTSDLGLWFGRDLYSIHKLMLIVYEKWQKSENGHKLIANMRRKKTLSANDIRWYRRDGKDDILFSIFCALLQLLLSMRVLRASFCAVLKSFLPTDNIK